jgi:hypothetical protein
MFSTITKGMFLKSAGSVFVFVSMSAARTRGARPLPPNSETPGLTEVQSTYASAQQNRMRSEPELLNADEMGSGPLILSACSELGMNGYHPTSSETRPYHFWHRLHSAASAK